MAFTSLAHLPTELYDAILAHVNPAHRQETTLALLAAIPRSPVPVDHLFRHVQLHQRAQIPQLWRRLAVSSAEQGSLREPNWVRSFELQGWDSDADVLVNTLKVLPNVKYLHLNIGTTFAPEHLDDLFRHPRQKLKSLSLRFRPYVEKATYYQFLKGQYSDILIEDMARWPSNSAFTHLSLLQDPLPSLSFNPQTTFAQPMVFFSIEVFRPFSVSPIALSITHLRIRIPSRLVLAQLLEPNAFPALRTLDIGTSALGDQERSLPLLLARYPSLEHLLLDGCGLFREGWRNLGRTCALAGQGKSRAREKLVNAYVEANNARILALSNAAEATSAILGVTGPGNEGATQRRVSRHGRRGVATAAFSIRSDSSTRASISGSEISMDSEAISSATNTNLTIMKKVRILPPLPSLLTLSTSLSPSPSDHSKASEWRREFITGWKSGVDVLLSSRARVRASARSGSVRVMRFPPSYPGSGMMEFDRGDGQNGKAALGGLLDVEVYDKEIWEAKGTVPLICFGAVRVAGAGCRADRERASSVIEEMCDHDMHTSASESSDGDREGQEDGSSLDATHAAVGSRSSVATQPLPSRFEADDRVQIKEDGHAHGCGHELHEMTWNIYECAQAS